MEKKTPAAAQRINAPVLARSRMRLHAVEDRLLLEGMTPDNQPLAFWLTRRMTLQLFNGLRTRMEKDSPAGKQPAAWRDEALALEHAAILKSVEGKGKPKPWTTTPTARVLTNVGVKVIEGRTRLALFHGKQPVAVMAMQSTALHRFVAMLALRIQQAGWDNGLDLSWLAKPQNVQRLPAKKAN